MDQERWQRIEALCEAAEPLDGAARRALLDRECATDPALCEEVLSLLAQLDAAPGFLERSLLARTTDQTVERGGLPPGTSIGSYRLQRLLGRGGMGEVYLASRDVDGASQAVALKVTRRGMATEEVLARFRLERRILANLRHPNVAQLLDAGATDDGRPYFVMEYVEGEPITQWCDARRLAVAERVRLFQAVCAAVQHAHQHLVVHRDIKPRNILVTADGTPKLLDFGIGKVLSATDALGAEVDTSTQMRLLTPEYAAPEQVTGAAVTTATDVYALGVLLYELLAGRHPYLAGDESRPEVERAVLEAAPTRPSTRASGAGERATDPAGLRRRLAGDLDTIVLMALRKEPSRRYPSASALAEDLQRHLDGLPVRARPDTLGYRTRKFVRRNAGAVIGAGAVFAALSVTTGVTLVQSHRVARAAARAESERDKALEVRGFLMELFGATGANQAVGDTVSARRLLDLQVGEARRAYEDRPGIKAEMLEVLADGYDRLGLYGEAETLAREALALRRDLSGPAHPDGSQALTLLGWILHERGRPNDAEPLIREAAAIRRAAGERYRGDLARSLNDLGVVHNAQTRYADAETVLAEALAIRRAMLGDGHRAVGITANNLAAAFYFQGRVDQAIVTQGLALRALQQSVGPDHQRTVVALSNLAAFKRAQGDYPSAEADYRDLLARQARLQGTEHPVTLNVESSLASVLTERGVMEGNAAVYAEAESLFRDVAARFERTLGPSHPNVGVTQDRIAGVLLDRGRLNDALATSERALAVLRASLGEANLNTLRAAARQALIRWARGDREGAIRQQRQVVASLERAAGASHAETASGQQALCGFLLSAGGDAAEALRLCATAERSLRTAPAGFRRARTVARIRLAQAQLAAGNGRVADSLMAVAAGDTLNGALGRGDRLLLDSLREAASQRR